MGAGQVRFGVAAMQQVRLDRHRGSARRGRHRGCRRHVVFDSVAGGERGLRIFPLGESPARRPGGWPLSRLRRLPGSAEQLVDGQREVAQAAAGGVVYGIRHCGGDADDAYFADALGAQFVNDIVGFVNEDHLDIANIGVNRDVVLGEVVVHAAAQRMVDLGFLLQGHAQAPDHPAEYLAGERSSG